MAMDPSNPMVSHCQDFVVESCARNLLAQQLAKDEAKERGKRGTELCRTGIVLDVGMGQNLYLRVFFLDESPFAIEFDVHQVF